MSAPQQQDLPNADLKRGDRILITEWVKSRAFVKTRTGGSILLQELVPNASEVAEDDVRIQPNQQYFGDVLEVLGVDYPWALFDVHTARGHGDYARCRVSLDVRDFNCRPVKQDYLTAMMSGVPGKPEPVPPAPPQPHLQVVRLSLATGFPSLLKVVVAIVIFAFAWRLAQTGQVLP